MVDIQTFSIVVASASVVVGVIYYALQLRNQAKQRQTELVTGLYSIYASEAFQKEWFIFMTEETNDYNTYRKKYAVEFPPTAVFFNEIGVLLSKKLIDIDLVNSLFGGVMMRYWERLKPFLESCRRELNSPRLGFGVEYLCNEIQKFQQGQ
jgi:hypothetical protein